MYLAFSITVLHGIVPHVHDDQLNTDETIDRTDTTSILNLLNDLFHVDLGEDHLEHFNKGECQTIQLQFVDLSSSFWSLVSHIEIEEESYSDRIIDYDVDPPVPIYYRQCLILRGPPAIA